MQFNGLLALYLEPGAPPIAPPVILVARARVLTLDAFAVPTLVAPARPVALEAQPREVELEAGNRAIGVTAPQRTQALKARPLGGGS